MTAVSAEKAAAQAASDSVLRTALDRGKLIVGTGSTNAPWHFKDENGNLAGFDIDMAKLIAKGLFNDPEKVEFVDQSSDARIPNVTTGKVDITCQFMTVTAERAQQVAFTIPYYREGVGLLLKKDGNKVTRIGFDPKLHPCFRDEFIHPNDLVEMMKAQREGYGLDGFNAAIPG